VAARHPDGHGGGTGVGEQIVFSIDVRNEGGEPAEGVTLTDAIPAGLEPVSVQTSRGSCTLGATVTCAIGTLDVYGGYASVYIATRTRAEGRWDNTASISSSTVDPNPANDSATATIEVTGPVPAVSEVSVTKPLFRVGRARAGTAFAFNLSEPAAVVFRIQRRVAARRWTKAADPFTRTAAQGQNKIPFSGRVRRGGRVRALRPGLYRTRLTAVDAAGHRSLPRSVRFRVIR
jgi:uncharacterized repeat protein (TIGR01451 family)